MTDFTDFADIAAENLIGPTYNEATEFHEKKAIAAVIREAYAPREAKVAKLVEAAEEMRGVLKTLQYTGKFHDIKDHMECLAKWRQAIAEVKEKL